MTHNAETGTRSGVVFERVGWWDDSDFNGHPFGFVTTPTAIPVYRMVSYEVPPNDGSGT